MPMANEHQVGILTRGVEAWNTWQRENPAVRPDFHEANLHEANLSEAILVEADFSGSDLTIARFSRADLTGADLTGANLHQADLHEADLTGACLIKANLREADLVEADLTRADLTGADLTGAKLNEAFLPETNLLKANFSGANLSGANLSGANIRWVDLTGADLTGANLVGAQIVGTYLNKANLSKCHIYGISAWDVRLDEWTQQHDLIITPWGQPAITVDNIEIAQFIYLLLHNEKVRHVIDAVTSKVVLILGRFTEERKGVLDAIRNELRRKDLTPILFDFEKPISKDLTGTVETLARMARFIIADLTDPSSIPHELATIVPFLRTTPVLPLRLAGSGGYSMFNDLHRAYKWVLEVHEYKDGMSLVSTLTQVISPANDMAEKLRKAT
jgi:uncharacterized protein YjbI with pentapeptide repeats